MRVPASLRFVAGFALILIVLSGLADAKRTEKKEEVKQENKVVVTQKPALFSFIKSLFPNPERTLENLKAVAATAKPQAKALNYKGKNEKENKRGKSNVKVIPLKKTGKPVPVTGTSRLRSSIKKTATTPTGKPKRIVKKTGNARSGSTTTKLPSNKIKTGKVIKERKTSITPKSQAAPPKPKDMVILTHDQKRDRLRQELVKETEDNCLAKILCGTGTGQPKPKEKNTFVSDTAYLIKEFFNIFDFTVDQAAEQNKKQTLVSADADEKASNDDGDEEEEEEDDGTDDEDDEIYRKSSVKDSPKKYTTNKPKRPPPQQQTSKQPSHKTRTSKPIALFKDDFREEEAPVTKRPKPIYTTTATTTTTTTTTTKAPTTKRSKEDGYGSILSGGDMAPVRPSMSSSKNKDRLGQAVTDPTNHIFTNTFISTSMSGTATLQPLDLPFEIPIQTAKDDNSGDDDEEDDNNKYDDRYDEDDNSAYHKVTLEELVGDIKLTPADMAMMRRGRSMKIDVKNVAKDKYVQSKLRQLKQTNNQVKKLRIAQKIGRSMREPRQCRQFNQVAEEVLQTCPLTTEVIRFFNSNLKNGSSIEVKKTPSGANSVPGGLVLLNHDEDGSQQAYFVDNSPQVANTKVETDLKNPSVPSSFGKDEDQYAVYEKRPNPNPQNAHLNQNGQDIRKRPQEKDEKEGDSDEEQDDDADSDEDEAEDDNAGRKRQEDDGGSNESDEDEEEDDDDAEDEEDGSDDDEDKRIKVQGDHQEIQGSQTNQPNIKVAFRPQPINRPKRPVPTLPPGVIRVYGIPQASFDKDFADFNQIGHKQQAIFGEEDIDRPAYKRRRQLPLDEDDEKEDAINVAHGTRVPKHPPLQPHVHSGDDDDDDKHVKKPFKKQKKHSGSNSGKPLGGLKGGDDDDDDDDDHKKKNNGHSIESVDLNESPFSPSGFYNPVGYNSQPQPSHHDYDYQHFHHHQPTHQPHQVNHHFQHFHHQGPPHSHYGYRPIVRPIQIIPDVQVPLPFRPTKSVMRPGRLYPLYHGK